MAKSEEKKQSYVTASYHIPSFALTTKNYDPVYDLAIVRKGKDGNLHFYRKDEEDTKARKVERDLVWADFDQFFLSGAMSHDIIPACEKILEADGWREEGFHCYSLYELAIDVIADYIHDFETSRTPLEAIQSLPQTHDDWLAELLKRWEYKQFFCGYELNKFLLYSEFYPNKHDIYNNYYERRFTCHYNQNELLTMIGYHLIALQVGSVEEIEISDEVKNITHDLVAISPSRNDNQELIKTLAKLENFCPELIQEALTEAVESLENRGFYPESRKETYLAEIYKLIDLINETAG